MKSINLEMVKSQILINFCIRIKVLIRFENLLRYPFLKEIEKKDIRGNFEISISV